MTDKSHVAMEHHVCKVCGCAFETGAILLDRRLRKSLPRVATTGWGFCPPHEKLRQDGYVALVECQEPAKTKDIYQPDEPARTGRVAHIRASAWPNLFNVSAPQGGMCFVGPGVIDKLQKMTGESVAP